MVTAPGRGEIRGSSQDKGPLHLGPHHRSTNGQQDQATDVSYRHSRAIDGRQGKGVRVFNPRPRAITPTGDRDGAPPGATKANHRPNGETQRDNVGVKVAMFAAKLDATPASINRVLIPIRRRRPPLLVASFVASEDATRPVMLKTNGHLNPP